MARMFRNLGAGLLRGATADVLGMPVDTLNMIRQGLLAPAEGGNPMARSLTGLLGPVQQTGSSDYFAQQMGLPQGEGPAYEMARMVSPSPTDIMSAVRRAPTMQELITYHGTPHRFEPTPANPLGEFQAAKIGSGEGGQAFGHGIYLAESPDVARGYRVAGGYLSADPEKVAADIVSWGGEEKALAGLYHILPSEGEQTFDGRSRELIQGAIDAIKSGKYKAVAGNIYTADLPDEMIDRMLDWDKPLSEQSDYVKNAVFSDIDEAISMTEKALQSASPRRAGVTKSGLEKLIRERRRLESLSGKDFYNQQSTGLMADQPKSSENIKTLGIPGIKYLDQFSRDKGKGTRNFVVFPGEEKKVKILKRE